MQIKNLGETFTSITGGIATKGKVITIEEWELALLIRIGKKVEVIEAEEKPTKKKKNDVPNNTK